MKKEHLIDQATTAERQARAEWESLLMRLQASDAAEVRLQRVRRAIARGEFNIDASAIAEHLIAQLLTS